MNSDAATWGVLGGLLLVSLAATGARALCEFSRSELEDICRRGRVPDLFGEILRQHQQVARGVESFVIVAMTVTVVAATAVLLMPLANKTVQFGSLVLPPFALILLGGVAFGAVLAAAVLWIPWTLSKLWAGSILYHAWILWKGIAWLMSPLVAAAGLFDALLHRLANRTHAESSEESFEEEIRSIVTEGHREGLLEEDAREMIESVIELGDATVSEIMTPRTDMQMFHVGLPWDEVLEYVIHVGHTRIPVYDKNRDDIVGILFIKDMLPELAKGPDRPRRPLTEILRKAYFVPQTKAIDDLLQEFQKTGNHMAVVLDEYGGVSGVVTIEDVLEEIVGEIIDEYDEGVVEDIQRTGESTWDVSGRSHIDEINARLGLQLPEDGEFDTIAGFVFSELGRIPSVGESIEWQDAARIIVLEATGRRIDRLRIELLGKTADEAV